MGATWAEARSGKEKRRFISSRDKKILRAQSASFDNFSKINVNVSACEFQERPRIKIMR